MRVAIVTESFPPDVNGVANSVARVVEHLAIRGHQTLVIAPRPSSSLRRVAPPFATDVVRLPAIAMPGYPNVRLGLPSRSIGAELARFKPDIVHLASPFVLGAWALPAARALDIPVVAVYQTDVAGYAKVYGVGFGESLAWRWIRRIHNSAARTLAPSTSSAERLIAHGIDDVWIWRRGVDSGRFHPALRRDSVRRVLAPRGQLLVGYVGRLAKEKRVELLSATSVLPGVRLVIVGDGPARESVRKAVPHAAMLGPRYGDQLAALYASLDVFVHTGPHETFCQTIQEAMASAVPVIAPDAGGPRDLVDHRRTGLLVKPNSAAAIVEALAELSFAPYLRASYGAAGRSAVQERSWSAVVDELITHYGQVLAGDNRTVPAEPAYSSGAASVTPADLDQALAR